MLCYRAGDWNALRHGLFGDLVFSLQVVVGLDEYGTDYTAGSSRSPSGGPAPSPAVPVPCCPKATA